MSKRIVYQKFTIWQMFSNIFVAAINKGQLPTAISGLLLVIFFIKLPASDLKDFMLKALSELKNGYLLGYFLFIITGLGWFFYSKRLRRIAYNEQERIGKEKSELQKVGLPGKIKSSKAR